MRSPLTASAGLSRRIGSRPEAVPHGGDHHDGSPMRPAEAAIALEPAIEAASVGRITILVCVLTCLALVFDGFDIQAIGFAAPRLMTEWGISRGDLASVLAAGLVGMGVGALVVGDLGDRIGRRRALIGCRVVIAAMSLLTARSQGLRELALWRFATGIGLGGALPNATALMVEFAPTRARNLSVALTVVGVPVGGMIGSAVAAAIVPAYGWAAIFIVGALLPALLAAFMAFLLPESPRYLATHPGQAARLATLMNRVVGTRQYDGTESWFLRDEHSARPGVGALFGPAFRHNTVLIWLIFFANVLSTYSFFNWTPTLLTGAGLPLNTALRGSLLYNLGGVVGSIGGAFAMNRLGSKPVMITLACIAVLSTFLLGFVPLGPGVSLWPLFVLVCIAGACINGQQVQMYTLAAHAYPTRIRATGVGSGLACARLGGIMSSFAGSVLVHAGGGVAPFFTGIAAVLLLTLTGVIFLRCHVPSTVAR